jgi:hypothetical protein
MKIRFIVFALLSATFASTGFVTRAAADDLAAAATRLAESDARIVLVRDGVTMPPMDPEAAAEALSERIQLGATAAGRPIPSATAFDEVPTCP